MATTTRFHVLVVTPEKVIFEGDADSVLLPGEKGVFEILPFHKGLMSRLLSGKMFIDGKPLTIKRGVAKVGMNDVTVIVEEATV